MAGVSTDRWHEAQEAEQDVWRTSSVGFRRFRESLGEQMRTAEWAGEHIEAPPGDWLAVGLAPLGISCTHFLRDGAHLHAVDPLEPLAADAWQLPEPCKAMLRSFQETMTRHVGRGEELKFADDTFAVVSMENVLDHTQDPGAVLREGRRVLKAGGYLLLTVDTYSALSRASTRLSERKMADSTFVRAHPHRFSSKGVIQLVADAGFRMTVEDTPTAAEAIIGRHYRVRLIAA